MKCRLNTGCAYVDDYFNKIRFEEIPSSKEMKKAVDWIEFKFSDPDAYIDVEQTVKAAQLIEKYFGFKLFPWELAVLGLIHAYYRSDDTLVFNEFLIEMGRGNGKNGFISGLAWYFTTIAHGKKNYNVDIVANSEDQAKTSFEDVREMLTDTWKRSQKFFNKPTKELIFNKQTRSYLKYNTSNAKTKDGKRTRCAIFDEIHEYQTDDQIRVFRSGLGKGEHCRTIYITTNGYVREGFLDDELALADRVLDREFEQSRLCPLIYKIDNDGEADDCDMWEKANPSLPYLPNLKQELNDNNYQRKHSKTTELDFFTKRMNVPRHNGEIAVTTDEAILATNQPLPDLSNRTCVVGIDFSKLNDWSSVSAVFKDGETRYVINHSWMCLKSPELWRIKAPWKEWAERGLITVVNDEEISPKLMVDYISGLMEQYNVTHVAIDNFRYSILSDHLKDLGFTRDNGNLTLVRPSNIYQVVPNIDHCFSNGFFVWGDNPVLRWATWNTMLQRAGTRTGSDTGNYYYAKIEGKSRKTDPFMSLVHAMCIEEELGDGLDFSKLPYLGVITF